MSIVRMVVHVRWIIVLLAALALAGPAPAATTAKQTMFDTPEAAVDGLMESLRRGDSKALTAILGPSSESLVSSGDPVEDNRARGKFVAEYDKAHRLAAGGGKIVLYVGPDDFPFPIPVVPDGDKWRFDTPAGKEEILNRRVGRNERAAIQVMLAYVDAQREYYARDRKQGELHEYAQRLASTPGKRDGLYWESKPGEPQSPFGTLAARARAEGYGVSHGRAPFHGYYYRILTAQGPEATGGASDYIANGHMIGGFAMVAFPAHYGVSGVMTFIVSHDGVVYQKDLGPNTAKLAEQMKRFDPDKGWQKVTPN